MHTNNNRIVPFAGHPAANIRATTVNYKYGLQPGASPLVAELAATIHATLNNCPPHALAAAAKAALRGYLCDDKLLAIAHRAGEMRDYRRHLLYADPDCQFSILAIVWQPEQCSAIHGHTTWGAIGVYEGNPYCEVFDTLASGQTKARLNPLLKLQLKPGDLAIVQPGINEVHRIGNSSWSRCITIHIYGRDLLSRPGSININIS